MPIRFAPLRAGLAPFFGLLLACTPAARTPLRPPPPALNSHDLEPLLRDLGTNPNARTRARDGLIRHGAAATPLLLPRLDDPSWEVRWDVVTVLGSIGDRSALGALVDRALTDPHVHVRWRALWALGTIPGAAAGARSGFAAALASDDPSRAWHAAVGLATFDDPRSLPALHRGLAHGDPWVRWEAVNGLAQVHDRTTSALLGPRLSDRDEFVRREAARVLAQICDTAAVPFLRGALRSDDARVRARVARGLGRCGDPGDALALRARLDVETDADAKTALAEALASLSRRGAR